MTFVEESIYRLQDQYHSGVFETLTIGTGPRLVLRLQLDRALCKALGIAEKGVVICMQISCSLPCVSFLLSSSYGIEESME